MSRRRLPDELPIPVPGAVRPVVRRWALQVFALVVIVGLCLAGILWFNHYARQQLRDSERFRVALMDIDCNPPSPLDRREFLEEVLYHSELPEHFSTLDDELSDKLRKSFARHPWVSKVEAVEVIPPKTIRLVLVYREPVLAVAVAADLAAAGKGDLALRVVDSQGTLLPKKASTQSLPILYGAARPVAGAGQPWGDRTVLESARIATTLKAHIGKLGITGMTWSESGPVLWNRDTAVLLGNPLSAKENEALLLTWEQRLLEVFANLRPIPSWWPVMYEVDLRPSEGIVYRFVPRRSPVQ